MDPATAALINIASAALLALAGLALFLVRPLRMENFGLGVFAVSFASWSIFGNLMFALPPDDPLKVVSFFVSGIALFVAGLMLPLIAHYYLQPLAPTERRYLWLAGVPATAYAIAHLVLVLVVPERHAIFWAILQLPEVYYPMQVFHHLAFGTTFAMFYFILILAAFRYGTATGPDAATDRRQYALISAGLMSYACFSAVSLVGQFSSAAIGVVILVLVSFLWLLQATRQPRGRRAGAVFVGLWGLACLAGSYLITFEVLGGGLSAAFGPHLGVSRLAMIALLAYAVLKYQFLGIDLGVKWTIRQGTITGAFALAFIVASEVLENFLPIDGPILGIIGASAVALGLRPLQDGANRFVNRIMPDVKPADEMTDAERLALYVQTLRRVFADAEISTSDRALLDRYQRDLGIDAAHAAMIEGDVTEGRPSL